MNYKKYLCVFLSMHPKGLLEEILHTAEFMHFFLKKGRHKKGDRILLEGMCGSLDFFLSYLKTCEGKFVEFRAMAQIDTIL